MLRKLLVVAFVFTSTLSLGDVEIVSKSGIIYRYEDKKVACAVKGDHLTFSVGEFGVDGERANPEEDSIPFVAVEIDDVNRIRNELKKEASVSVDILKPSDTQFVNYQMRGILYAIPEDSDVAECSVTFRMKKVLLISLNCQKLSPEDKDVHPRGPRTFIIREKTPVRCSLP